MFFRESAAGVSRQRVFLSTFRALGDESKGEAAFILLESGRNLRQFGWQHGVLRPIEGEGLFFEIIFQEEIIYVGSEICPGKSGNC